MNGRLGWVGLRQLYEFLARECSQAMDDKSSELAKIILIMIRTQLPDLAHAEYHLLKYEEVYSALMGVAEQESGKKITMPDVLYAWEEAGSTRPTLQHYTTIREFLLSKAERTTVRTFWSHAPVMVGPDISE